MNELEEFRKPKGVEVSAHSNIAADQSTAAEMFNDANSFQEKPFSMYQGDCLELMKAIPDKSVDLIFCDLPYGTTRNKWDSILPLDNLWREYRRICEGAILLTAQTPFDKILGASNIGMLRYEWIWEKPAATGHMNAKRATMKAHENVLVFYDNQPIYNPIKTTGHARKTATADRQKKESSNYGRQLALRATTLRGDTRAAS